MCAERVLILSDQPLFAQGVHALIQASDAAEVVGVEPCDEHAVETVRDLRPDIIIFEDTQGSPSSLFPMLLDVLPNVRLIRLSLEKNVMRVYDEAQFTAAGAQDLVRALELVPQGQGLT